MSQFPRLNICYRNLEEIETDGITVMGAFTSGWFGIGIGYWTDGDQFIDMLQFGRGIVEDAHRKCIWWWKNNILHLDWCHLCGRLVAQIGLWTVTRGIGIPVKCTQTLVKGSVNLSSLSTATEKIKPHFGWDQSFLSNNSNELGLWR